jgi:hypothetical protein
MQQLIDRYCRFDRTGADGVRYQTTTAVALVENGLLHKIPAAIVPFVRPGPIAIVCDVITRAIAAEELDWLQPLFGYPTPPVLAALGSRTTAANAHNLPVLGGLWRVVPLLGLLLACGLRHPALPRLSHWTGAASLALFGALIAGGGKARALDEAVELGLVLAVWLGWERRPAPQVEVAPAAVVAPPGARAHPPE